MGNEKFKVMANEILMKIGGKENVASVSHCATRLRLEIIDMTKVDKKAVNAISGVSGSVEQSGQYQVILGPGNAGKVASAFGELVGKGVQELDEVQMRKNELKKKNNTPFKNFLRGLSNVFVPLIPAFIGCGFIYGLCKVLGNIPGIDENFIAILGAIGKAIFTYMNIVVGMNVMKALGGTPVLGAAIAGLFMSSAITKITIGGEALVADAGGVIAVLIACSIAAVIEKKLHKVMPSVVDLILTPTLTLLIVGFGSIYIIYPISTILTNGLAVGVTWLVETGGVLVGAALSGAFLPLVMTGLHRAITPIETSLLESTGIDLIRPILAMAGAGQVGAGIAIMLKTKSKKLKNVCAGSIPIGILGIGEPLMFGVTLPLGKPFLMACLGSVIGGAYISAMKVACLSIGLSGIPLTILIDDGGHINYLIGYALAVLGGFLLTYFTKWQDMEDDSLIPDGDNILNEMLNVK